MVVVALACASMMPTSTTMTTKEGTRSAVNGQIVRIALAVGVQNGRVSATGSWRGYESSGNRLIARSSGGSAWSIDQERGGSIRVSSEVISASYRGPIAIRT